MSRWSELSDNEIHVIHDAFDNLHVMDALDAPRAAVWASVAEETHRRGFCSELTLRQIRIYRDYYAASEGVAR